MTFLNSTFGEVGAATEFFSGQWWLVGFFLIIVFGLYMYGKGVRTEGMILFLLSAFLLVTIDNLFIIAQEHIVFVVAVLIIFVCEVLSRWLAR